MNTQPHFERLLSVEDEELSSIPFDETNIDAETCKVPMMDQGNSRQVKQFNGDNMAPTMYNFNLNGRHFKVSAEQLKYLSLITLTVQNAALILTMRAAKTQTEHFSNAVAVTVSEILKFITCLLFVWYEDDFDIKRTTQSIRNNIINNYLDTLKVAVPSLVYYVQNNLLYVASTHLDAATGQVIYQLKILTTAIFSVTMLGKKLSHIQWISLVILFFGVALIEQLAVSESYKANLKGNTTLEATDLDVNQISPKLDHVDNPTLGFISVLIACCLSGFAGVYFEKILKNSHVSLWIRNLQLSVLSIPFGLFQVFVIDNSLLRTQGLWHGFTPLTWLCILLQVQGGLLVAVVVKFANNILKGFATSLAIVISTIASMFLFHFHLTPGFVFGASLVIGSVMMYNKQ